MKPKVRKKYSIEDEIDRVIVELSKMEPGSADYVTAVGNLEMLYSARSYKSSKTVSNESILTAATAIGQMLLMLNYERLNVLSTKAISFVFRGRL